MRHQNVGARDAGVLEQLVQVDGAVREAAELRSGIAPLVTGAVVGTDPREIADLVLDGPPDDGGARSALLDDHRRARRGSLAEDMQPAAADIDEAPRGRIAPREPGLGKRLVDGSGDEQQRRPQQHENQHDLDHRVSPCCDKIYVYVFNTQLNMRTACRANWANRRATSGSGRVRG